MMPSRVFSRKASTPRSTYAITVAKNKSPQITQRKCDVAGLTAVEVIHSDYMQSTGRCGLQRGGAEIRRRHGVNVDITLKTIHGRSEPIRFPDGRFKCLVGPTKR